LKKGNRKIKEFDGVAGTFPIIGWQVGYLFLLSSFCHLNIFALNHTDFVVA